MKKKKLKLKRVDTKSSGVQEVNRKNNCEIKTLH